MYCNVVMSAREKLVNSTLKKTKDNSDFLDQVFSKIYKRDTFELLYILDRSFSTYAKFSEKLTFPTSWYAHGSKKCWFFGNFCVHTKWTVPSIISFLGQFVYLDLAKFRTTFLKPLPILHLFPCFHRFSCFWYHLPRVSRVGVGGSIAGVKTWKGVRYSKMFRRRITYLDAWWTVTPE